MHRQSGRLVKVRSVSLIGKFNQGQNVIMFNIVLLEILSGMMGETRNCIRSPLPGRVESGSTCLMKSRM
jgi:hypothetical protein